ncbi:MAG: hypothetical protein ACFE9N_05470 [Promethearchaeota archaeon]
MYFYWAIVSPILPALAIVLSAILVKEKRRVRQLFFGSILIFNINIVFNIINVFRRDYNSTFSIFPLSNYILYLIILNAIFISVSTLLFIKLDIFKQNRYINGIQSFFYKIKNNIFKIEKISDIILSIFIIFCLFYIVGFLNLFIHEFGHAMADVIFGTYYKEIRINMYLQGWTAGGGISAIDEFYILKLSGISLGGLIAESLFALFTLIIIIQKKERNNFTWLLSIAISMLFLNRVALYFTFPVLLNISSDVLSLANLGFDPLILFFIFFPFLIITFIFTFKLLSRLYKTSLNRDRKFMYILFLGLTTYIIILNIVKFINEAGIPLIFFNFY